MGFIGIELDVVCCPELWITGGAGDKQIFQDAP